MWGTVGAPDHPAFHFTRTHKTSTPRFIIARGADDGGDSPPYTPSTGEGEQPGALRAVGRVLSEAAPSSPAAPHKTNVAHRARLERGPAREVNHHLPRNKVAKKATPGTDCPGGRKLCPESGQDEQGFLDRPG